LAIFSFCFRFGLYDPVLIVGLVDWIVNKPQPQIVRQEGKLRIPESLGAWVYCTFLNLFYQ
jgi:hypothetical protein